MMDVVIICHQINGNSFEIACYRNCAYSWRHGETIKLSEVLKSEEIYEDASDGTLAKKADLKRCFGSMTKRQIIVSILQQGVVSNKKWKANRFSSIIGKVSENWRQFNTGQRFPRDQKQERFVQAKQDEQDEQDEKQEQDEQDEMYDAFNQEPRPFLQLQALSDELIANSISQQKNNLKMSDVVIICYQIRETAFEIICDRILAERWRSGQFQNLTKVLKFNQIYRDAQREIVADKDFLKFYFAKKTKREIIKIILSQGVISDKEWNPYGFTRIIETISEKFMNLKYQHKQYRWKEKLKREERQRQEEQKRKEKYLQEQQQKLNQEAKQTQEREFQKHRQKQNKQWQKYKIDDGDYGWRNDNRRNKLNEKNQENNGCSTQ